MNKLTCREREVVSLVAEGLQNKEIGHLLGTSMYTVRNQLSGIYQKIGVSDRVSAAVWYVRQVGQLAGVSH